MIHATLSPVLNGDQGDAPLVSFPSPRPGPGSPVPLVSEPGAAELVFVPREPIVLREIAGERLLVPIRRQAAQMKAIFALVGAGAAIFELLDGERSLGAIRDALVERFEVAPEQAWAELCDFVEQLQENDLVERRD